MLQIANLHACANFIRHPVLDTGLGFSSQVGAEGSQAPHQVRGDEAGWSQK